MDMDAPPDEPGSPPAPLSLTPLTRTQWDCLCVIADLTEIRGYGPNYQEIMEEMDLPGRSAVARLVQRLERAGWIARRPAGARAITLLRRPLRPDLGPPVFVGLFDDPRLAALARDAAATRTEARAC